MVAAWIKAETGVGPSIASGNQVCSPICADFPHAPKNNNAAIISIISKLIPKNNIVFPLKNGVNAKTVLKSSDLKTK